MAGNKKIESLRGSTYSLWHGSRQSKGDPSVVYIPFFGRIGDAVIFLGSFVEYKKLFSPKRFVLGCRNEVRALLDELHLLDGVELLELDRERLIEDSKYLKMKVKEVEQLNPGLILHVSMRAAAEDVFLHAIRCGTKVLSVGFQKTYNHAVKNYFHNNTYQVVLGPEDGRDQFFCYAQGLKYLGKDDYKTSIYRFPKYEQIRTDLPDQYAVVAPGASSEYKRWPPERFAFVIGHVIEEYGLPVVFCGSRSDEDAATEIIDLLDKTSSVINLVGRTTMQEWISTISNAKMVLSNESGTVHIAASCATPCICIGEQKYGDMWLPYKPERIRNDDTLPTVVRAPARSCFLCGGHQTEDCLTSIATYGKAPCILDVSAAMILEAVTQELARQ